MMFATPEFLDRAHRAMNAAELRLHLRQEIQLLEGQPLGHVFEDRSSAKRVMTFQPYTNIVAKDFCCLEEVGRFAQ